MSRSRGDLKLFLENRVELFHNQNICRTTFIEMPHKQFLFLIFNEYIAPAPTAIAKLEVPVFLFGETLKDFAERNFHSAEIIDHIFSASSLYRYRQLFISLNHSELTLDLAASTTTANLLNALLEDVYILPSVYKLVPKQSNSRDCFKLVGFNNFNRFNCFRQFNNSSFSNKPFTAAATPSFPVNK